MLIYHSRLLGTCTFVTIVLLCCCVYFWIRAIPLGRVVPVLHGIVGLLYASAAVMGALGGRTVSVPLLHVLYASIWPLVWVFLWKGVERFVAPTEQARFWSVSLVILLVLLHRIAVTGQ